MYMMHKDNRVPVQVYVDACSTWAGAVSGKEAYHAQFPASIVSECYPIYHLEALNTVAALHTWAPKYHASLLHLYCDGTAMAIFHAGKGRDAWIQAYAYQLWLTCARYHITLGMSHISGELLTSSADDLSQHHKDRVTKLLKDKS